MLKDQSIKLLCISFSYWQQFELKKKTKPTSVFLRLMILSDFTQSVALSPQAVSRLPRNLIFTLKLKKRSCIYFEKTSNTAGHCSF